MTAQVLATRRYSISDIKAANTAAGRYFFSKGANRFFNSRILATVYQGEGGIYFVTGERFDEQTPVRYTVRSFDPLTGEVDTVGEFNQLDLSPARSLAKQYAHTGV